MEILSTLPVAVRTAVAVAPLPSPTIVTVGGDVYPKPGLITFTTWIAPSIAVNSTVDCLDSISPMPKFKRIEASTKSGLTKGLRSKDVFTVTIAYV